MKKIISVLGIIILIGLGIYFFNRPKTPAPIVDVTPSTTTSSIATTTQPQPEGNTVIIGTSVEGRPITAYNFGTGSKHVLFIGGVHGGYSWNTALLAYQAIDYFKKNPQDIPPFVTVTIIPVLNPDGLQKAVGTTTVFTKTQVSTSETVLVSSRFNAHAVDLSRNFDCNWKATGIWQKKSVSGGTAAFSEPESLAIKNYILSHSISAAVVWYSSADGVYSSNCNNDLSSETAQLTTIYSKASGYSAHTTFDAYETSGDIVNWFSKIHIPAISVLLATHNDTEWMKNLQGIQAILAHYGDVKQE